MSVRVLQNNTTHKTYFRKLSQTIVEADNSEIHTAGWQTGTSDKSCFCSFEFEICRAGPQAGNSGKIFFFFFFFLVGG